MTIYSKLSTAVLEARKAKDEHAVFLATILSEVIAAAKAAKVVVGDATVIGRAPTDDDADKIIRSTIKSFTKTLDGIPADAPYALRMKSQLERLKTFIPEALDDHHLSMAIRDAADFNDVPVSLKSMGVVMKRLNEVHPGQINGVRVRELLESGAC